MLKIILSLVAILSLCGEVTAKDGLFNYLKQTKQKHVKKKYVPKPDYGSVIVRPWPLINNFQVPLSSSSETLASVFGEYDLISTVISLNQNKKNDQAAVLIRPGTPTTIAIIRKNRVLVFPRVMLLHPSIRNIRICNGDIVASMNANSDEELGGIYKRLIPEQKSRKKVTVELSGHFLASAKADKQVTITNYSTEYFQIEDNLDPSLRGRLKARSPIFVMRRIDQGTEFLYVTPFEYSGFFAATSNLMKALSAGNRITPGGDVETPDEAALNLWEKIIPNVINKLDPRTGDQIEVTELEVFLLSNGYAF